MSELKTYSSSSTRSVENIKYRIPDLGGHQNWQHSDVRWEWCLMTIIRINFLELIPTESVGFNNITNVLSIHEGLESFNWFCQGPTLSFPWFPQFTLLRAGFQTKFTIYPVNKFTPVVFLY